MLEESLSHSLRRPCHDVLSVYTAGQTEGRRLTCEARAASRLAGRWAIPVCARRRWALQTNVLPSNSPAVPHDEDSMTTANQQFASDNYSGVCPEAWEAMARAN